MASWLVVLLSLLIPLSGPPYLASSVARAAARTQDPGALAGLPAPGRGWQGPQEAVEAWRPLYSGALTERSGVYRDSTASTVDVFVAVYGLGVTAGAEMISYGNRLTTEEDESLVRSSTRALEFGDGGKLMLLDTAGAPAGRGLPGLDVVPGR